MSTSLHKTILFAKLFEMNAIAMWLRELQARRTLAGVIDLDGPPNPDIALPVLTKAGADIAFRSLEAPAEGTWAWGLAQLHAGKDVRRKAWSRYDAIYTSENKIIRMSFISDHEPHKARRQSGKLDDAWPVEVIDFEATDWEVVQ